MSDQNNRNGTRISALEESVQWLMNENLRLEHNMNVLRNSLAVAYIVLTLLVVAVVVSTL